MLKVIEAEEPGESILERLEEVREMAEKGSLSSVAIAVVYRDGSVSHCASDMPNRMLLIGAIEAMKFQLLDQ